MQSENVHVCVHVHTTYIVHVSLHFCTQCLRDSEQLSSRMLLKHICSLRMYTIFSTASKGGGARSKQPAGYVDLTAEHKQDLGAQGNKHVWICHKCKVYVIDIVVS